MAPGSRPSQGSAEKGQRKTTGVPECSVDTSVESRMFVLQTSREAAVADMTVTEEGGEDGQRGPRAQPACFTLFQTTGRHVRRLEASLRAYQ